MPTASARARAASATPSGPSRSSTGSGSRERCLAKGVTWKLGKVFQRRRAALRLRPPAGERAPDAGLHQPAAILPRALPGRARGERSTGIEIRWRNRAIGARTRATTASTPDRRDAGRPLRPRRRLGGRRRRRALVRCGSMLGLGFPGRGVRGPLPDRRRAACAATSRRSAGSGSTRPSTTAARRSCTSSRTTSGASTCSSARTRTRRRSSGPSASCRACGRCSATTTSPSNGCRSTPSSAAGSSASCTGA